jgi:hypothetical protein
MKIYKPIPDKVVRLTMVQQGSKNQYLTLCETNKEEVKEWLKDILKDKCDVFPNGRATTIHIRDAIGAKNLQSISLRLYGLTPIEISDIISIKLLKNK